MLTQLIIKDQQHWFLQCSVVVTLCTEMLIQAGTDVNIADEDGCSALIWAAKYGNDHFVEILISAGADVNHRDKDRCTALDWARSNDYKTCR